jgi:hypothetical protein
VLLTYYLQPDTCYLTPAPDRTAARINFNRAESTQVGSALLHLVDDTALVSFLIYAKAALQKSYAIIDSVLEEEIKLNEAIAHFVETPSISGDALSQFLTVRVAHPDYYTDFTGRVIKNLSALNVHLLNELPQEKRFHLLKALCLTVEIAYSMKMWEFMLGRKDGAWYWNKHGLFFSTLHNFIPLLNSLQKQIAAIGQGFTGRIACLEGPTEERFLELLHFGTRLFNFNVPYFVYGGKGAHQNLVYYIQDKNEKELRVDLAYDGDSNFSKQVSNLQRKVAIGRLFKFARDFEAAFPPEMLAAAVTEYVRRFVDPRSKCSVEEAKILLADRKTFVKAAEERYKVSISKPTLGELLAFEFLKLAERDHRVLHGTGAIAGSELSRFIRFIMDLPEEVSEVENAPDVDASFDKIGDK